MVKATIKIFCVSVSMIGVPSFGAILDDGRAPCKTFRMKRASLLAGCVGLGGAFGAATGGFAADLAGAAAIADPFATCRANVTRDKPQALPPSLKGRAAAALGPAHDANLSVGYFWRCMGGAVYVCVVGANIPCESKADRARRNAGAAAYCHDNKDADGVPAYATGHATIYAWRCVSGAAIRGKAVAKLDPRGYRTDIWHRLSPDAID
jgi:hypothetical protein